MINTINSTSSTHTYLCIWYTVIFTQVSANFRVVKWHMPALSTFSPKKKYGSTNYLRNTRITLKQIYNSSGNFEIAVFVW